MKKFFAYTFMICLVATPLLVATPILYEKKEVFVAATNATSVVLATAPIAYPEFSNFTIPNCQLTFRLVPGLSTRFDIDYFSPLQGLDLALSGKESFDIIFNSQSIYAFGVEIFEPTDPILVNGTFEESTFEIKFVTNWASYTFLVEPPNDIPCFLGIVTGNAEFLRQVCMREISGGIENEFFQFLSSTELIVPELPTMFLYMLSFLMGWVYRRFCSNTESKFYNPCNKNA